MNKTVCILIALLILLNGCVQQSPDSTMRLTDIKQYLLSYSKGTPVSTIENDLQLPAPTETEASACDWPHWKFKYFTNDNMIYFLADEGEDSGEYVYYGDPYVCSIQDYWECVSDKKTLQ